MAKRILIGLLFMIVLALLNACAPKKGVIMFDSESVFPGTQVSKKGETISLIGPGIELRKKLLQNELVEMKTMKVVDLNKYQGSVLFLSIVPSIDTRVCEAQTHFLGEEGGALPKTIKRITISRDTPFAQTRFAKEAKLEDIDYLCDYKEGAFGKSTGLLMAGSKLLARSIVLVDKQGIVRYIQVVPDVTHLPDMNTAFKKALELDKP